MPASASTTFLLKLVMTTAPLAVLAMVVEKWPQKRNDLVGVMKKETKKSRPYIRGVVCGVSGGLPGNKRMSDPEFALGYEEGIRRLQRTMRRPCPCEGHHICPRCEKHFCVCCS